MSVNKKVLALITFSESTKKELCNQLSSLLEDYMDVIGYATETGVYSKVNADLVIISSSMMEDMAKELVDEKCPVIIANRSLNLEKLDKLFHISKDTEVVVVNDEMENSIEIIKLLEEIGINYLKYVPYAPGYQLLSKSNIAITPGETGLVPSHINTIIDIGPRVIDLTTIIEILSHLNLLYEQSRRISYRYLEAIIKLNKRLHDSMEEAKRMNQYLMKVLNQVNDGILSFSDDGMISVCNEASAELFGERSNFVVGKYINQIVKDKKVCTFLLSSGDVNEQIFKINDTEVLINKFRMELLHSTVCTIKNTKQTIDMEKKIRQNLLKKGFVGKYYFRDIVGNSDIIKNTVETAKKLARTDLGILIYGESGVGKELFASAIHNESSKRAGSFLAVNFSALPEELIESELFGYEEGAFTGAKKGGQRGLFEQANGGTIFLDEIGDISLRIQTRLLRILQEKEIRRVGGTEIIPINVRIIAATNKNLAKMCQEKIFREDLYHRLKKLYLKIPPLRERIEDIDDFIRHFVKKNGYKELNISEDVMNLLYSSSWNGNVRELENVIEYFLAVYDGNIITLDHMPQDFQEMHQPYEKEKEWEEYIKILSEFGNLEEFYELIKSINCLNHKGESASRIKVYTLCEARFPYLTEDKVRRKTDLLKDVGLITKKAGKTGMRLTNKGIKFLRDYPSLDI